MIMSKKQISIIILLCFFLLISPFTWIATTNVVLDKALYPPIEDDFKYRIAYVETEPWLEYPENFVAILKGLEHFGWIDDLEGLPYVEGQYESDAIWAWLVANPSPYLEFIEDAHYTLSLMGDEPEEIILKRLEERNDIDLIICMGTSAGQILKSDRHSVPIAVFASTNAYESGIVNAIEYSKVPNVWAHMDPDRYQRQFAVFHDIFKFEKMGLVYEDSEIGLIYAAMDDAQIIAKRQGFEIIAHPVKEPENDADIERYYNDLIAIHEQLASEVDAMYLTMAPIENSRLAEILSPFYEADIPVFSQLGSPEVRAGALLSIAQADGELQGQFFAETIIKILKGTPAEDLMQLFQGSPHIAINLEVAELIAYQPLFEILLVADLIFTEIAVGEE